MQVKKLFEILGQNGFLIPKMTYFTQDEKPQIDFYPVVLKIDSPKVIHKSDLGAVILNICDAGSLEIAKSKIISNLKQAGIQLDSKDNFIAVEMINGEEFYLGAIEDSIFGKVILFGKGGVLLELYHDVCYIDVDANEAEIHKSIKQTNIVKLFEGFRNSRHTSDEVIKLIRNFQNFLRTYPDISELDLNPIMLAEKGFIAVDARVKFSQNASSPKVQSTSATRHDFFSNKSIALVGASHNPAKVGYALAKNL